MVADQGSAAQASQNLFRTQSAIARSIRELELTLAAPLFERQASGMLLTDMGNNILPRAKRAILELKRIPPLLNKLINCDEHHRETSEPLWLFNTRRLEIFLALYRLHHTESVARTLGISQPAVSTALKILEKGARTPLFQRTSKGMIPTPAGREIAPSISLALNEISHIPEDIAAQKGVFIGDVNIGALPLSRARLLPQALIRLTTRYPGIRGVTHESMFDAMVSEMRAGNIDFIIGALRNRETVPDLESEILFEEELTLLAHPHHPLVGQTLKKEDLNNIKWVLPRKNAPSRKLLEQAFKIMGLAPPQPMVESGDLAVIRALLLQSDMVAVVSSHQLDYEVTTQILKPLKLSLPETRRKIGIMYRQGALHSPAARALIECIREVVQEA